MKEKIAQLQGDNTQLKQQLNSVASNYTELQTSFTALDEGSSELKSKLEALSDTVNELKQSESNVMELVSQLSQKVTERNDQELKEQLKQFELFQIDTKKEIEFFGSKLAEMESSPKPTGATSAGIFSYIEKETDQNLFIEKIEEAIILEMTYAQIDEHLTESLPAELDKIIKDHPSLTKDYIRSLRS